MVRQTGIGPEILRLRGEGKSYRQIVEELGCSKATVAYWCTTGEKEKTLARTRARTNEKRSFVFEYKQGTSCVDCGEEYPYWKLQFDHVKGKKVANVSTMVSDKKFSLEDVKEEIAKCEVVCANCHCDRTYTRLLKSGDDSPDVQNFYS